MNKIGYIFRLKIVNEVMNNMNKIKVGSRWQELQKLSAMYQPRKAKIFRYIFTIKSLCTPNKAPQISTCLVPCLKCNDTKWGTGTPVENQVQVSYLRGFPQITVPLPSRGEKCKFTLRPVLDTVGDFLYMLRREDPGIDQAVCLTPEGTRIASSDSIGMLLEQKFLLIINDKCYPVSVPVLENYSRENEGKVADIRVLVHQLYEALHVQDYEIRNARELSLKLKRLKGELEPLVKVNEELNCQVQRRNNFWAWAGLGLLSVQFGFLLRLTWWEYSWDVIEPFTYFLAYGMAMAAYSYFVLTKKECGLANIRERWRSFGFHKKAKQAGLDINKFIRLKDQICETEASLEVAKHRMRVNLPHRILSNHLNDLIDVNSKTHNFTENKSSPT